MTLTVRGAFAHHRDLHILEEVMGERERQDEKFGADRDMSILEWFAILSEEELEVARAVVDGHFEMHPVTKNHHNVNLREELIQVAAVCVAMVDGIDRGST